MNIQDYSKLLLGYYYHSSPGLPSTQIAADSPDHVQSEWRHTRFEYDNLLLEFLTEDGYEIEDADDHKLHEDLISNDRRNNSVPKTPTIEEDPDLLSVSFDPPSTILPSHGDERIKLKYSFDSSLTVQSFLNGFVLSTQNTIYVFGATKNNKSPISKVIELGYDIDAIEIFNYLESTPFAYVFTKQLKLIVFNLLNGQTIHSVDIPFRSHKLSLHKLFDRVLGICFVSSTCIYTITHLFHGDYGLKISNLTHFAIPVVGSLPLINADYQQRAYSEIPILFITSSGECLIHRYKWSDFILSRNSDSNFTIHHVSEFGNVRRVISINHEQHLFLFEEGWCVYNISQGKLHDYVSSPISQRFEDVFVNQRPGKLTFCISMVDGSAMLVDDGAVRMIRRPGSVIGSTSFDQFSFLYLTDEGLSSMPISYEDSEERKDILDFSLKEHSSIRCNIGEQTFIETYYGTASVLQNAKKVAYFKIFETNIEMLFKVGNANFLFMDEGSQLCIICVDRDYKINKKININLLASNASDLRVYFVGANNFLEVIYKEYQCSSQEVQCVIDLSSFKIIFHDTKGLQLNTSKTTVYRSSRGALKTIEGFSLAQLTEIEEMLSKSSNFQWISLSDNTTRVYHNLHTGSGRLPILLEMILLGCNIKEIENKFFEYASSNFDPFYLFYDLAVLFTFKQNQISEVAFKLLDTLISGIGSNIHDVVKIWEPIIMSCNFRLQIESCVILGLVLSNFEHAIQRGLKDKVMTTIIKLLVSYRRDENRAIQIIKLLTSMCPTLLNFKNNLLNPMNLILTVLKIQTNELTGTSISVNCTHFLDKCFETNKEYMTIAMAYIAVSMPSYTNVVTVLNKTGTSSEQHNVPHRFHLQHKGELEHTIRYTDVEIEVSWKATLMEYINYKLIDKPQDVSISGLMLLLNSLFVFHTELLRHPNYHTLNTVILDKLESVLDLTCNILRVTMTRFLTIYDVSSHNIFSLSKLRNHKHFIHAPDYSHDSSSQVFISVDRSYLRDVQYSGLLYTFSGDIWVLNLLRAPDLADHFLSKEDQMAIATLHTMVGSLPYISGAKFSSSGRLVAGLNLETFSITVWHSVSTGSRESKSQNITSKSPRLTIENPIDFSITLVKSFWQRISNGQNPGSKRLEQTIRYLSNQIRGHDSQHSPVIQPTKQICFADIFLKYFTVFQDDGIPIGLDDINIEWLLNDRISLKIGDKVIFVYSV